jgi:hypothetical protein
MQIRVRKYMEAAALPVYHNYDIDSSYDLTIPSSESLPTYHFTDVVSSGDRTTPASGFSRLPFELRWEVFHQVSLKLPFWHCSSVIVTSFWTRVRLISSVSISPIRA